MNPGQFAQQIRHMLGAILWPGTTSCVFGDAGVSVVAGRPSAPDIGFPWAMVSLGTGDPDEEDPELVTQSLSVFTGVKIEGDRLGEHAIIGGALGSAGFGRGLVEVDTEVRRALGKLTGADGCPVTLSATSMASSDVLEGNPMLAIGELVVTARCTSLPAFTSPQRMRESGGVYTWNGGPCSARFDFIEFVVVDTAGPGPASSPAAGDTVYQGTATTTSNAVSGVATVFAAYGTRDIVTDYSRPINGTFV